LLHFTSTVSTATDYAGNESDFKEQR